MTVIATKVLITIAYLFLAGGRACHWIADWLHKMAKRCLEH